MTEARHAGQATLVRFDDDRSLRLRALARSLKTVRPDTPYLAGTLLSDGTRWGLSFQSNFAGFPDGKRPDHGVEFREPSLVHPDKMTAAWDSLGQGWIVVNEDAQLAVYFRLGGNALIAQDLAGRRLAEYIKPRLYANVGPMGFRRYDPQARESKRSRPRPSQKRRILERDGHCCQKCENAPTENDDLGRLQIHHIKPFGKGGPTVDDNLITLCRRCHESLDPHDQPWLFWYSDGHLRRALDRLSTDSHQKGVEAYRQLAASLIDKNHRP